MQVIGDKNQISEDVFDFMISYLPFPQKSIRSELANFFSISIANRLDIGQYARTAHDDLAPLFTNHSQVPRFFVFFSKICKFECNTTSDQ